MLLTALLVTEPSAATAQSFDCRMAATAVEKMICADRELATLDEEMARAFAAARKRAAAGRIGQAGWLKDVRNRCADAGCLKNAYRQRIAHLGDLEELAGEWTRLGDHQFTGAYLTIAAVTATEFTFELTARNGANHGLIEGTAGRTAAGAVYTDEESECVVRFARKADRLVITLSDDCLGMGGMGVTFDGEFAQGDIAPIALTLANLDLLAPGVSEEQFASVVGGAYAAFTSSFQLMFDKEDLDGFGAKAVTGGVRGLVTEMEAIVMSHGDGRIFAAVLDDGEVKYFSNDPMFTTRLPATIEHWRRRFADKPVIFGSAQTSAPGADPNRVYIEASGAAPPVGVPTVLLVQLKKDLGESDDFPKTVDLLAQQIQVQKLALVDPRNTNSTRSFPRDAEFYWLSGPRANCGAGGRCSSQLYWASPSAATSGRLFPTSGLEDESAFNTSPSVLRKSSHGLFDLALDQMLRTTDVPFEDARAIVTTLTFDGHRYVIQSKKLDSETCKYLASLYGDPDWTDGPRFGDRIDSLELCAAQTPDDSQGYLRVAASLWEKAYLDKTLTDAQKLAYVERGLGQVDRALALDNDLVEALVYKGLLLRTKALVVPAPAVQKRLIAEAVALQDRAKAVKARTGTAPSVSPLRVEGQIAEPRKLTGVSPVYPPIAQSARVQGVVTLECTIGPDGRVTDATVLRGIPLLDQAAIDAVKQWVYTPTFLEGVPVSVIMTVTVTFKLN